MSIESQEKTIDDVTREEWGELAEAAIDLLTMSRFMLWLHGGYGSEEECLDKMAFVLSKIGLPQLSREEYDSNIEQMLKSGLPPDEWKRRKEFELERVGGKPQ